MSSIKDLPRSCITEEIFRMSEFFNNKLSHMIKWNDKSYIIFENCLITLFQGFDKAKKLRLYIEIW